MGSLARVVQGCQEACFFSPTTAAVEFLVAQLFSRGLCTPQRGELKVAVLRIASVFSSPPSWPWHS